MALKIIEGVVEELGAATILTSQAGPTGACWSFVKFGRGKRNSLTLDRVVADQTLGSHITPQHRGRFAFYPHDSQFILCGFSGPAGLEIAAAATDPAAIAAEAIRTPAKRKIFWGVLLIPTIIGLVFAIEMIKAGGAILSDNPSPKRPSDARLTRALKGQLYWPF